MTDSSRSASSEGSRGPRCSTREAGSPGLRERLIAHTPLGRAADPEEIAQAAAWLLSDRSSFVTGAVLRVDGGARA